jgi:hypothetical protein
MELHLAIVGFISITLDACLLWKAGWYANIALAVTYFSCWNLASLGAVLHCLVLLVSF